MWLAATNSFSLGSGLGTHCNRKRRLNAAVLRARPLLSPHSSHLDSACCRLASSRASSMPEGGPKR